MKTHSKTILSRLLGKVLLSSCLNRFLTHQTNTIFNLIHQGFLESHESIGTWPGGRLNVAGVFGFGGYPHTISGAHSTVEKFFPFLTLSTKHTNKKPHIICLSHPEAVEAVPVAAPEADLEAALPQEAVEVVPEEDLLLEVVEVVPEVAPEVVPVVVLEAAVVVPVVVPEAVPRL